MKSYGKYGRLLTVLFAAILIFMATISIGSAWVLGEECSVPFKADAKANAVAVSPPPILEIYVYGSGHSTHMGNTTVWQHHFVNLISMTFYDGTFVWTAANGDTIMGSYYGSLTATPIGFEIHGYFTIDGGTGRFGDAKGGGIASGMQYRDNTADLRLDGTIAY